MTATTFRQLHARLKQHSKRPEHIEVTPDELLIYFRNWTECLYTADPIRVESRSRVIRVRVGDDVFEVPRRSQNFYETQAKYDAFLRGRLGWEKA